MNEIVGNILQGDWLISIGWVSHGFSAGCCCCCCSVLGSASHSVAAVGFILSESDDLVLCLKTVDVR